MIVSDANTQAIIKLDNYSLKQILYNTGFSVKHIVSKILQLL